MAKERANTRLPMVLARGLAAAAVTNISAVSMIIVLVMVLELPSTSSSSPALMAWSRIAARD